MDIRNDESGFTLIELLTIVLIIGMLAAISINQYSLYRTDALNARAANDLRNAVTASEAYYTQNEVYVGCADTNCAAALPAFVLSNGVSINLTTTSANSQYEVVSYHLAGSKQFVYHSDTGSFEVTPRS